jgi:phage tail-like protein
MMDRTAPACRRGLETPMAVRDPYARKYFRLEIDGISPGGFESAQGLSWETEVLEFNEGGRNDALVRLPGQGRLGKVTLVRGYIANHDLASWAKDAAAGRGVRRSVDVVVLNDAGEEAARYTLLRAWPTRYEVKELASQQGHAVDSVELAHEGIIKGARSPGPPAGSVIGMLGPVASALATAEQAARDQARAARQAADMAEAAAQAAGAAAGVAGAVAGAAATIEAGGNPLAPFLPAPPASPVGASPLDAAFVASASAGVSPPPAAGGPPAGVREALVQGSPLGQVTAHESPESFTAAMADGGSPPSPAPAPAGASGAGFAATGTRGTAATSAGDWSDGVARQQAAGQVPEPPIEPANTLRF